MKTTIPTPDSHQEMREALRALCRSFESSCWQRVDHGRGYPEEFVTVLSDAGALRYGPKPGSGGRMDPIPAIGEHSDTDITELRAAGAI
jgi:hypothetical protein